LDNRATITIWTGIALVTMLLGLAIGIAFGNFMANSSDENRVSQNTHTINKLQEELLYSQSSIEQLGSELEQAREGISEPSGSSITEAALKEISNLKEEISQLRSSGLQEVNGTVQVRQMSESIENHRVLLVEMRKDKPIERQEAYSYWKSIKSVASLADPSLSSPVDKIIISIDNYFDWNERTPSLNSQSGEYIDWLHGYDTSGAVSYEIAIVRFNKDALLSLITELDLIRDSLQQ